MSHSRPSSLAVDPDKGSATVASSDGMQPEVRLSVEKAETGARWGGLIQQIGEDSILQ